MTKYGQYTVSLAEECVNLGVGQPSKDFLPLDLIKKGIQTQLLEDDVDLLQYGDIPGYKKFRQTLAKFINNTDKNTINNKVVNPDDLFITNGVTQALTLICSLLTKSGDTIFVEEPTYFLAINIFKDFNLNVIPVPIDKNGLIISELKKLIDPNTNNILYTIPSFHNPTGYTMSHGRRVELVEIENLTIIADEVYQYLYFDTPPPPSLYLYAKYDNVISLGSFSKILAPSLRLGWITTSKKYMDILCESGILDSSGGLNPIMSSFVQHIIENGDLDKNLTFLRNELKSRCYALAEKLPKENFIFPKGGYFIWFNMEQNVANFNPVNYKVKFHNGSKFSFNKNFKNYIRLSFSYYRNDDLKLGAERLLVIFDEIKKNKLINISVKGANGRLGSLIKNEINESTKYRLLTEIKRDTIYDDIKDSKIIIDVSSVEGLENLLDLLITNKSNIPLLIGTTGFGNYLDEKLNTYSQVAPVSLISNFSEGVPLMCDLISKLNLTNGKYRIRDTHHVNKKDSPSGTALTLKKHLNKFTQINSFRQGDVIGEHTVSVENDFEKLEITHVAKDRRIFAVGCMHHVEFLLNQKNGLYYSKENTLKFTKYSGCGNDFIIVDNRENTFNSNVEELCSRKSSIGSDGLILLENTPKHDFKWIYYNSDGKTAEMCGNGARCVAHFANTIGIKKKNKLFYNFTNNYNIETEGYVNQVNNLVKVSLPSWEVNKCPDDINLKLNKYIDSSQLIFCKLVKVGVLHLVICINDTTLFNKIDMNEFGKNLYDYLNSNNIQANINLLNLNTNEIRTYEKGVFNETLACGTGCCSSLIALNEYKSTLKNTFKVKSGEFVTVEHNTLNNKIYLEGNVSIIYNVN
jgi:2-aminoadipate transaminase